MKMPIGVITNVLAVVVGGIIGTVIGLAIHLGDRITAGAMHMQRLISRVMGDKMMSGSTMDREEYELTQIGRAHV